MQKDKTDYSSFKEFTTEEETNNWINANYQKWLNKLQKDDYHLASNDIADILYYYTGGKSEDINNLLLGIDKSQAADIKNRSLNQIQLMRKEINKYQLKEDIIVWRYINKSFLDTLWSGQNLQEGSKFFDKSFVEATLRKINLEKSVKFKHCNCLFKSECQEISEPLGS